ncbi:MAG TPA: hypothetical protein PKK89_14325, partial [Microthrixaceae bacterium]|nr:hypothetical protein [Microthrixaceae bacterium]
MSGSPPWVAVDDPAYPPVAPQVVADAMIVQVPASGACTGVGVVVAVGANTDPTVPRTVKVSRSAVRTVISTTRHVGPTDPPSHVTDTAPGPGSSAVTTVDALGAAASAAASVAPTHERRSSSTLLPSTTRWYERTCTCPEPSVPTSRSTAELPPHPVTPTATGSLTPATGDTEA